MDHQYSSASSYGAQYPQNSSYYTPYDPSAGQPMSNGTSVFQQPSTHNANPSLSSPVPNAVRYDANAQVHAQPTQLPFAPPFNPDILKHFPPPPPPPIPHNAHFGVASGAAVGYPFMPPLNASHSQIPQPGYSQLPQQQRPSDHDPIPSPKPATPHESPLYQAMYPTQRVSNVNLFKHSHGLITGDVASTGMPLVPMLDGGYDHNSAPVKPSATDNKLERNKDSPPLNNHGALTNGYSRPQLDTSISISQPSYGIELKERAKAAILSLVPHSIHYEDILAEGINSHVLQQLYGELGLRWQPSTGKSEHRTLKTTSATLPKTETSKPASQAVPAPPLNSVKPAITKLSPATTPASRASPVISSGMERKDRIAQLLAAKAGKTANAGAASKSQSPALTANSAATPTAQPGSQETSTLGTAVQSAQVSQDLTQATPIGQRLMEHIHSDKLNQTQVAQALNDVQSIIAKDGERDADMETYQLQLATSLPTPIRERLVQDGLSSIIPGLFMTSADPDEDSSSRSDREAVQVHQGHVMSATGHLPKYTPSTQSSPNLQKRSIEEIIEYDDSTRTKRQNTQADNSVDTPMEVDGSFSRSASEGEIIEDGLPAQQEHQSAPQLSPKVIQQAKPDTQGYSNKQMEIDTTRRRTVETEQRQNLKRGPSYVLSPDESANSTPMTSQAPQTILSSPSTRLPGQIVTSSKSDERGDQSSIQLTKATPEQIAEKAARLKAEFLRQRALRKKPPQESAALAPGNEAVKTQNKLKETRCRLDEIRKELREFEMKIGKTRETEEELIQEIERLEKQVPEGESSRKPLSSDLDTLQRSNGNVSVQPSPAQDASTGQGQNPTSVDDLAVEKSFTVSRPQTGVQDIKTGSSTMRSEPQLAEGSGPPLNPIDELAQTGAASGEDKNVELSYADQSVAASDALSREVSEQKQLASRISANSPEQQSGSIVEQADNLDESMDESDEESDDSRMSIDEESNDSASMSDGSSDDYEPAEPELSQQSDEKAESEEYEPGIDESQPDEEIMGEGDDDYEPAEDYVHAEDTNLTDVPEDTPPTDNLPTPSTTAPSASATDQTGIVSQMPEAVEVSRPDDLENGLQLSEADTLTKPQALLADEETDGPHALGANEPSPVRYVPYQSPLSSFKSYRFHPLFKDSVKDGYRSLTYSHKIDPKMPFCPSELAGSECTDPECSGQHLSSMVLTDDKILVQMSSANDIKDKDLRDQYLIGLKSVIARLRQEGVKEFVAVANALSQYRRDWTAAQTGY